MVETASKTTPRGWLLAGLFAATVLAGAVAAVMTLHARAATDEALPPRPTLTVEAKTIVVVPHYTARESYVGRIEPARETMPAAERAGLLVEVLVNEGDRVVAGQTLARLDLRPLELSRMRLLAERQAVDADIELAERTTERRSQLVGDGWASGQAYDDARFSVSGLAAQRAALDAQIAQIDLDVDKSAVLAPFDGRIAARMVDEGTVIAAGTALLHLQEITRPQARVGVPSDRASELNVGDPVRLAYQGRALEGRIAAITPDLDIATRTVPVLIDLPPEAKVTMGQVIRLGLDRHIEASGAWVDLTALQEAERGLWSLMTVVREDGADVIRREAVEILHVQDGRAFVRGTFADGARVVAQGGHRISAGQKVTLAGER
ncbi:MAG: efflux RND transporter periplasmic adaptor subunit [Pseudomonadota bacterium]